MMLLVPALSSLLTASGVEGALISSIVFHPQGPQSYRWRAGGAMRLTRVRGVPLAGEALGFGDLGEHYLVHQ